MGLCCVCAPAGVIASIMVNEGLVQYCVSIVQMEKFIDYFKSGCSLKGISKLRKKITI